MITALGKTSRFRHTVNRTDSGLWKKETWQVKGAYLDNVIDVTDRGKSFIEVTGGSRTPLYLHALEFGVEPAAATPTPAMTATATSTPTATPSGTPTRTPAPTATPSATPTRARADRHTVGDATQHPPTPHRRRHRLRHPPGRPSYRRRQPRHQHAPSRLAGHPPLRAPSPRRPACQVLSASSPSATVPRLRPRAPAESIPASMQTTSSYTPQPTASRSCGEFPRLEEASMALPFGRISH